MTRFDFRSFATVAAAAAIAITSSFAIMATAYVPVVTSAIA